MRIDVEKRVADGDKVIGRISACDDDEYPYNVIYYYRVQCESLEPIPDAGLSNKQCIDNCYSSAIFRYDFISCVVGNDNSSTSDSRIFSINKATGEITVNSKTLDNSDLSSHTFCINASSSPIDASMNSAQWKVVVNVKSTYEVTFLKDSISTSECNNIAA